MPMHDWTKVPDGIFHAFHHRWISSISDELNSGRLPADYYALPEQVAAGLGPEVLTLQERRPPPRDIGHIATASPPRVRPQTRFTAEAEGDFYRRKKKFVVVRHVSGDRVVAVLEIVSPGNKAAGHAFAAFVQKALDLLEQRIHLLVVDPFPPGPRDPNGIHAAIWQEIDVGDTLPEMALFVEPNEAVLVPLEATYQASYAVLPRRWREVLDIPADG
jgi:hypothetical protein